MGEPRGYEPLTTEEEARYRHYAYGEPWNLPDRINTIRAFTGRLFATIDAARSEARSPAREGLLREALERLRAMTWPDDLTKDGVHFAIGYMRAALDDAAKLREAAPTPSPDPSPMPSRLSR